MKLLSCVSRKTVNDIPALNMTVAGIPQKHMYFYSTRELKPQKKQVELHLLEIRHSVFQPQA